MNPVNIVVTLVAHACLGLCAIGAVHGESRIFRIGYGNVGPFVTSDPNLAAFRQGLRRPGYVEGRILAIDFRWGDGHAERLPVELPTTFETVINPSSTAQPPGFLE